MAYLSYSNVIIHNGETWWVNSRISGIDTKQMKKMLNELDIMLGHHNKVFLLRFDLHQGGETENSSHVSQFFERLKAALIRKYGVKRVGYAWAREKETAKQQHYHCILMLDGNIVQRPHSIIKLAKIYWEKYFSGSLSWPSKRCSYLLRRGDRETQQKAIYHFSYLAKGRGKGKKPRYAKNYQTSRLTRKR